MAKKNLPQKEKENEKEKKNERKENEKHKQTINQKHNIPTENIIPTPKQQHMIEKLTHTRYIQIGQNIQEQATLPAEKKKHK